MGLLGRIRRRRRWQVPDDVLPHLGLAPGERVLAAAPLTDRAVAVATSERLLVASGASVRLDVAWYEVDHGAWEPGSAMLDVRLVTGRRVRVQVVPETQTLLPEVVRERVQSSVVLAEKVDVQGRRGVRVVVRRSPRGLLTQVLPDVGIDVTDPVVAGQVAALRDELARAAGMAGPA